MQCSFFLFWFFSCRTNLLDFYQVRDLYCLSWWCTNLSHITWLWGVEIEHCDGVRYATSVRPIISFCFPRRLSQLLFLCQPTFNLNISAMALGYLIFLVCGHDGVYSVADWKLLTNWYHEYIHLNNDGERDTDGRVMYCSTLRRKESFSETQINRTVLLNVVSRGNAALSPNLCSAMLTIKFRFWSLITTKRKTDCESDKLVREAAFM